MLLKPQKPVKEKYLTSLRLFYIDMSRWSSKSVEERIKFFEAKKPICYCCGGTGLVKDTSQRCVVEGLKYADYITCPVCNKTGFTTIERIRQNYRDELNWYKEKLNRYRKELSIYNSIKKKLTKEEFEWLIYQ